MNEIIVNLEGKEYQIDIQKAKDLGILKEKDTRCKSWEEFKLKYKDSRGYFYESTIGKMHNPLNPYSGGEQLTKQEAIAINVFSKLLKLRRDWIGTWEPNWHNSESKYCIAVCETHIKVNSFCAIQQTFSFPTREMAEEFLQCFEDLFVQCKCLI
jgi:hypothetical protein